MDRRTFRGLVAGITALSLGLGLAHWARAGTRITMGGGAPGGTYYTVVAAMAKVLEDKSGGIQAAVETTKGSAHALRLETLVAPRLTGARRDRGRGPHPLTRPNQEVVGITDRRVGAATEP